ncbi:hypothetical protein MSAN_00592000 [Mycena sanguinolenta]|uniref:Uncharacterized protein n=1 Tax=Mycena sanguinolenta TaxID=230812 RepID=A0A8H6Z767_9AGAR|nr:hypothetical protein MSAN_00592000 [Mycena sanguinolenta]
MPFDLPPRSHYLLLRTSQPVEELALRQILQENLSQAFGVTASGTHLDVLWVKEPKPNETDGRVLIRVDHGDDATRVLASIVASSSSPRLALIKASAFLPSLLLDDDEPL